MTDRTFSQAELNEIVETRLAKERRRLQRQHERETEQLRRELQQERQRRFSIRLRRLLWWL